MLLTLSRSDPGASDDTAAKGLVSLSFGKLFEKASVQVLLRRFRILTYNRACLSPPDNAMSKPITDTCEI